MTEQKNKQTAGADEKTPSRSEYFSWVNNTNEGSTEEQTLKNLAYFRFLHDTYGMQLDIYAWDAGNLDGSIGTYQTLDSPKIKAQYPGGYEKIVREAEKSKTRLGVWCGPDGFGDTAESALSRRNQMVSLCRDYNFALFKIDGVCGQLSVAHRPCFVEMMKECRKYSPDLILLNHRLELGEGMPYATTFLYQGQETYVDVHISNSKTAMHHRQFMFGRGNIPGLLRLTEDHGVCLSSFPEYFEDELIYQAFGRCLILAPQIYGNPWLLRDDEQPHLARIFNLHRRFRDILVDGMLLPQNYPDNSISRGNASRRFLTLGNDSWVQRTVRIRLDTEIGLEPCDSVTVCAHHPYEKHIGSFSYGDAVDIPMEAFRAALIEVCDSRIADTMLTGCEYEVLHENDNGLPDRIKIVSSTGNIARSDGTNTDINCTAFDNTRREPIRLASTCDTEVPENAAMQLEAALFAQNQDSFEARFLRRSGETAIPEVKAARDAFFAQKTYMLRGPESAFAFDGRDDTFFDGVSRTFFDGFRNNGGCLRVDFGGCFEADTIMIEYFDADEDTEGAIKKQILPKICDYSADLMSWNTSELEKVKTVRAEIADVLVHNIHNIIQCRGHRRRVFYPIKSDIRYFRMPEPIDRIYKIALYKDGIEQHLKAPTANNLLPYQHKVAYAKKATLEIAPELWREGCYLAIALEGKHGAEGAYAVIETQNGACLTCPDRAPAYNSNVWECAAFRSIMTEEYYTYFFPVPRDLCGCPLTVGILGIFAELSDYTADIYLCDTINGIAGKKLNCDM